MRSTKMIFIAVAALLPAATAMALPVVKPNSGVNENAPVLELVNGSHRACARGPAGWHYHVRGERISCESRPSGRYWGWTVRDGRSDWWHSRDRRWRSTGTQK